MQKKLEIWGPKLGANGPQSVADLCLPEASDARSLTVDGDTVKALFFLPAVPAFAICFGFAVETIGRRSHWLAISLGAALTVCLVVSLTFGIA